MPYLGPDDDGRGTFGQGKPGRRNWSGRLATPLEEPRRVPWTYALAVGLVAFAVWLLLFAPTLQRNAQASPVGARRTVSMDLVGPIATVSRGLQLSHIVSVADGIVGKSGGTGVHSAVSSLGPHGSSVPPTTVAPTNHPHPVPGPQPTVTTTTVPAYQHPTPSAPLRVLIIGDSLGLDLGQTLQSDLAGMNVVLATMDGKESTGLTRPDYFNWPAELQADLPKYQPQVVVIMVGANDPQDFPGPPDIPYDNAQWDQMYTQAVNSFMKIASSTGAKVIWVGMPPMADGGRTAAMAHLDSIYQSQAAMFPGVVTYVDPDQFIAPGGQYTAYLTSNGQQVQVRTPDGIHIAGGGAELLSQAVIGVMRQQLGIVLPG